MGLGPQIQLRQSQQLVMTPQLLRKLEVLFDFYCHLNTLRDRRTIDVVGMDLA